MLTTVIIILREFLEAALLISLLLVLHLKFNFYQNWIIPATLSGIAGAFLYAQSLTTISGWFNGSGQEIINGLSLLCIGICLAMQSIFTVIFYKAHGYRSDAALSKYLMPLTISAIAIIVIAITREGAEIFVYYSSINLHPEKSASMIIGGVIGGGLGVCIGILAFVTLYQININRLIIITSVLLTLITAGIMSEAMQSFIQAGLLITDEPIWDSSGFIRESSIVGQLLYATFAYEATPTMEEVCSWLLTAVSLFSLLIWIHLSHPLKKTA